MFDFASSTAYISLTAWNIAQVNRQNGTSWEFQDYVSQELRSGMAAQTDRTFTDIVPLTGGRFPGYEFTFRMIDTSDSGAPPHGYFATVENGDWIYEVVCLSSKNPPDSDFEECREMVRTIAIF
jgi:hypothetical protein